MGAEYKGCRISFGGVERCHRRDLPYTHELDLITITLPEEPPWYGAKFTRVGGMGTGGNAPHECYENALKKAQFILDSEFFAPLAASRIKEAPKPQSTQKPPTGGSTLGKIGKGRRRAKGEQGTG